MEQNLYKPEHNHQQINQFFLSVCLDIVPFDEHKQHFIIIEIHFQIKISGQLIGDNDLLIAARALALNALLVTQC